MTPTLQELGIDKLSITDRIALVEKIEESIARELEEQLPTGAQRVELRRRVATRDADPGRLIAWEVVKDNLLCHIHSENK